MKDGIGEFLAALRSGDFRVLDRAVAAIWWHSLEDATIGLTVTDICQALAAAGYPATNASRLREALANDPRTRRVGRQGFGISVRHRDALEQAFGSFARERPIPPSDSVLPQSLFDGTRGYIERVVAQINASFDAGLYDCTAVMCRRLLETLIIEAYESKNRAAELKGADGHFMMFSGLLSHLEDDTTLNLGRESMRGLRAFKTLGDQSAHNRRFNARRDDVARIRDGLRLAAEELLHLAGLL